MRLAIVGIRGLPNNYGGFETLADYLVEYLAADIDITVYCSSVDMPTRQSDYKGAKLKYIPVSSHGAKGIIYDSISLINSLSGNDKVLFLGFGAGFVMPFLSKRSKEKITLNIGGLDWKRNKWSALNQKVIKAAEGLLIKNCGKIISDNIGIQQYITEAYKKPSALIAYGGDQAKKLPVTPAALENYPFLNSEYAFTVTRIQSDNNIDMILDAFLQVTGLPLVIVGNWDNSEYGIKTKAAYLGKQNVFLLDAIYDRDKLDILRSNCTVYIHGHSAGGTNPSLAEAMYLALPVFAFASGYNEHTTGNKARYFKNEGELVSLVNDYKSIQLKEMGENLKKIADDEYRWSVITEKYKNVINN